MAVFLIELFPVDSAALELPIRYSIGRVDKRFGISESQLREAISLAEEIWETPLKMELFEYDPSAALKINLVYDGRQQFAVQSRLVETDLKKIQNVHSDLVQKYERLTELHRIQQNRYYQTKSEENRRLANALAVQINQLAAQLNKLASTYNSGVASYRQRYGGYREFIEGTYTGKEINVYQFYESADLTLVLAHEMGHALGIDHVQNSKSLMYPMMGDQDVRNLSLSREDFAALSRALRARRK